VQQDNINNPGRRASDLTPSGLPPTIYDVWKLLVEVNEGLAEVKRQQKEHASAFIKDDLDRPDFDGHRKSHIKLVKAEEIVQEYKMDATKKILGAAIVFILGLLSSGVAVKIGEHVK